MFWLGDFAVVGCGLLSFAGSFLLLRIFFFSCVICSCGCSVCCGFLSLCRIYFFFAIIVMGGCFLFIGCVCSLVVV